MDVTVALVAGDSISQSINPKTNGAPERTL